MVQYQYLMALSGLRGELAMQEAMSFWDTVDPHQLFVLRAVLAALLVLAAVLGTRCIRRAMGVIERGLKPLLPRWFQILTEGFTEPLNLLLRFFLLYCAALAAPIPIIQTVTLWRWLTPCLKAAAVFLIAWGFWRSAPLCGLLLHSAENTLELGTNRTLAGFFENIYKFIICTFAVLVVLDIFGVPVASLVAGAGIAGLAVSLAAQSTLSNLIAGVTLVLEHPFGVGDYITLGEYEGTVEDISFRSTRLRTPDNVAISIENSKVCSEYIQNGSDRSSRLWTFTLRLPYDTPYAKLEGFCQALRDHLAVDPQLLHERTLVTVDSVGEDGIKIMLRLYSSTADYYTYLRIRDRINREILLLLDQHGCKLAYPPVSVKMDT